MSIAITIINYNSKELLTKLIKKIESFKIANLEIWVVDNQSPDDFREIVKKEFSKVNFIQSEENGGFAKGQNIMLKKVKTDLALILNPDTDLNKEDLVDMIKFMEQNPECAVSSGKIVGFDNKAHSNGGNFPFGLSLLVWLFNLESLPGVGKSLLNFHRVDEEYYQKGGEVDWVGGTFMFGRVEDLKKVNFFNEKYFMYFEDVDICYRLKKKDMKVMLNPNVSFKHLSGASSDDPHLSQFKGEIKGLKIFYEQYGNGLENLILPIFIYLSILLRILAFGVLGKFKIASTYGKVLTSV